MVTRVFRRLFLNKIAAVDRPCQEGATMAIMKRAFTDEERKKLAASGAAMPGGEYPIENKSDLSNAIDAFGRAKDKAKTKAHIIARAKALGASDELPDTWTAKREDFTKAIAERIPIAMAKLSPAGSKNLIAFLAKDVGNGDPEEAVLFDDALAAKEVSQEFNQEFYEATNTLCESICSILCDPEVERDKMIDETITQFTDHVRGILPEEMEKALAAGFAATAGGARISGDDNMDAIRKALGLPATATEADVLKAMEDKAKKDKEESDKKMEKLSADELKFATHKNAKFPEGGFDAFQAMKAADRAKHMKDNPPADDKEPDEDDVKKAISNGSAFKTADGIVVHKKDFGGNETAFNVAKKQEERIAAQAAELKKRDEGDAISSFAKRATDLGFVSEFGETLRKAYAGDKDSIGKLETEIKALRKQVDEGKLFASVGSDRGVSGDGYTQVIAKAEELRKSDPKLTIEQAFAKVYEDPAKYAAQAAVELYKREKRPTA